MRSFLLAVMFVFAGAIAAIALVARGFVDIRADTKPSGVEAELANAALDASANRHAGETRNPLQPTDDTLRAGAILYRDNCSGCHGDPANPEATIGKRFYPPAPQFVRQRIDLADNQLFYIIQHGIRWTGMPASRPDLTANQFWQIVRFLDHINQLPAAARQEFKKYEPPSQ